MSLPTLSDYCLLEKIGTGSYATVYKASKKVGALDLFARKRGSISEPIYDNRIVDTLRACIKNMRKESIKRSA